MHLIPIGGLRSLSQGRSPLSSYTGQTSQTNQPYPLSHNFPNQSKVDIEKWKISFNGTGNVSDFLFKIETLQVRSYCSDEHLMNNFQILLTGKAETWYWDQFSTVFH